MPQLFKSKMFPVSGLDLKPEFPTDLYTLSDNVAFGLNWLVGKLGVGSVLIEGTSAGALKVADVGSGLDAYESFNGTAGDAYTSLGVADDSSSITLEVMTNELSIQFVNTSGGAGDEIDLTVGWHSFDFAFSDVNVKNETGGSNSVYQIIVFR